MKAADADRAAMLVRALNDLDGLEREAQQEKPAGNYDYRAMTIAVENCSGSGSSTAFGGIEIDLVTARKIIPWLRSLLRAELVAIGIEV